MPLDRRRRRWLVAGLIALLALAIGLAPHRRSFRCTTLRPPAASPANARMWLIAAIAAVPCPQTARAVYGVTDNLHEPMVGLDPVDDPAGGYLGVFQTGNSAATGIASGHSRGIALAHSADLFRWKRLRVIDRHGAGSPALEAVPGHSGYLLAYAKAAERRQVVRVLFYRSLPALLAGRAAAHADLPLRLSPTANLSPSFLSIVWGGSLSRSVLTIAFQYDPSTAGASLPIHSREAVGVLRGFRHWAARRDTAIDTLLNRRGMSGSHGEVRQFDFERRPWRIYDAQPGVRRSSAWHILLYDVSTRQMVALPLITAGGRFTSSFSSPVARVLAAPSGHGRILVSTLFVGGAAGAGSQAGELVYIQPIA